jgi:hypothetical protein
MSKLTVETLALSRTPARRPEVSNPLVLCSALYQRRDPHQVAAEIAGAGSAAPKRLVTEAVNERFPGDPRPPRRALRHTTSAA